MSNPLLNTPVGSVEVSERNPPIPVGDHRMIISRVEMVAGIKNRGKHYVVVELGCEASTDPTLVGQTFSALSEFPGEFDRGAKFCKAVIAAAMGFDIDDPSLRSTYLIDYSTGAIATDATPTPQRVSVDYCQHVMLLSTHYDACSLAGRRLRVTGSQGKAREGGDGHFTNLRWSALPDPAWTPAPTAPPQPPAYAAPPQPPAAAPRAAPPAFSPPAAPEATPAPQASPQLPPGLPPGIVPTFVR